MLYIILLEQFECNQKIIMILTFGANKDIFISCACGNEKCFYCKTDVISSNLHVDHFYPQKEDKLVIACQDCNRLKWQRNGKEFMDFLKNYISRFS